MKKANQNHNSSIFQMIVLLLLNLSLFVCSCDSGKNTNTLFEPQKNSKPTRDCRQEYNQLSQKKYYSISEARKASQSFLSDFNIEEQCYECCDEVRKMEAEFANMDILFSNVDNSMPENRYCAFCYMVKSNDNVFSRSSYEAVRKTWEYLIAEKKDDYLRERLNLIEEDDFKPYLINYAKELASEWYGGGGPSGWIVKDWYILNNEMEGVMPVDGKAARKCACTVHINMEGAMGLGLRSGSVDIWVEGVLGIGTDCNVFFSKGAYNKTRVEGGLKRRG